MSSHTTAPLSLWTLATPPTQLCLHPWVPAFSILYSLFPQSSPLIGGVAETFCSLPFLSYASFCSGPECPFSSLMTQATSKRESAWLQLACISSKSFILQAKARCLLHTRQRRSRSMSVMWACRGLPQQLGASTSFYRLPGHRSREHSPLRVRLGGTQLGVPFFGSSSSSLFPRPRHLPLKNWIKCLVSVHANTWATKSRMPCGISEFGFCVRSWSLFLHFIAKLRGCTSRDKVWWHS